MATGFHPHGFRPRGMNDGPRSVETGHSAKENGAIAYCLVKSRPYDGHSYDDMISATGSIAFPPSRTVIMLPQVRDSTTIPVVDKLRTILADEAILLDAKTRSVWCLQLDPLTVMNTLSQLGFRASQFSINPADGVHTWTLACSGKNAVKKAVQKVATDGDRATTVVAHANSANETSLENLEERHSGKASGSTNGDTSAGLRMQQTGQRRLNELSSLYEQSSHADYDNEDDDDFSFPSENDDEMQPKTSTNANNLFLARDANPIAKKPFVRKSLELMPKSFASTSQSSRKVGSVGSVGERTINKSGAQRRPRTNILPEQYDYMFQQFSFNSNPTRTHIEAIAERLGLSACVVRVWFQNARALERRGVLKVPQQSINKRCPICRVRFSARSSLEQHMIAKHSDAVANRSMSIDRLPSSDTEGINEEPITSLMSESPSLVKNEAEDDGEE